ncbi:MAG: prepilin-type N-terminal cleavage/methylation domain-containing protein [Nitrospiria bacterium]
MNQKSRGFTLIEILITVVLLAILTSGLMAMFTTYSQNNGNSPVLIQATELAKERMEQILADKYNTSKGFNYITNANYPAESPVAGFAGFNRSVNIFFVNPTGGNLNANAGVATNYKNISVTVTSMAGNVTTSTLIGSF